jgi:XapX domain-containing protein
MRTYIAALAAGVLINVIYSLLGIRSPAPPVVALVGLLGVLLGEQALPAVKRVLARERLSVEWIESDCVPHVFGRLPTRPEKKEMRT